MTESKVAFYCKIYERFILISLTIYVAVPVILEFQASQLTRNIAHLDVGLFNDL